MFENSKKQGFIWEIVKTVRQELETYIKAGTLTATGLACLALEGGLGPLIAALAVTYLKGQRPRGVEPGSSKAMSFEYAPPGEQLPSQTFRLSSTTGQAERIKTDFAPHLAFTKQAQRYARGMGEEDHPEYVTIEIPAYPDFVQVPIEIAMPALINDGWGIRHGRRVLTTGQDRWRVFEIGGPFEEKVAAELRKRGLLPDEEKPKSKARA